MFISTGPITKGVCLLLQTLVPVRNPVLHDLGGGVLLFILGSNLGGVGPERGLRGGRKTGVV